MLLLNHPTKLKKFIPIFLTSAIVLGAGACSVERTSADAPNSVYAPGEVPDIEDVQETVEDAKSDLRQAQIASDERARAQRQATFGDPLEIDKDNIESLVRNRLETRLPASILAVDADENGLVTISGTVQTINELNAIAPVAMEVPGVQVVELNVQVAPAIPEEIE